MHAPSSRATRKPTHVRSFSPRPWLWLLLGCVIAVMCLLPARLLVKTWAAAPVAAPTQPQPELAWTNGPVSTHVAGHSASSIRLMDGHDLLTAYDGPEQLRAELEHNEAQPLALAAA